MRVSITSNIIPFREGQDWTKPKLSTYSIYGKLTHDYVTSEINFDDNGTQFANINGLDLFKLANEIRGRKYVDQSSILERYGIKLVRPLINYFEADIIKTLFNIILWIEYSLLETEDVNIEEQIFNEFIIDYSGKTEPQKDLYFLPQKYCSGEYEGFTTFLIGVNLIGVLHVETKTRKIKTFYIPFFKVPLLDRRIFNTADVSYYGEWLNILRMRDAKLKLFLNK